MTNILLTGTPGSGKTQLVESTRDILRDYAEGQSLTTISLGDIVAAEANRLWRTQRSQVHNIDTENQRPIRSYAIAEAGRNLLRGRTSHVIVDTPLTMHTENGSVPHVIFNQDQISQLSEDAGGFDYLVSVIDDPAKIGQRLASTSYPKGVASILDWTSFEVGVSGAFSLKNSFGGRTRHLVIPREYSEQILAKLLLDKNPPVLYNGFPITHLTPRAGDSEERRQLKEQGWASVMDFIATAKEYWAGIIPMVIPDQRVGEPKERGHTIFRDKHWFDEYSDGFVAYFPVDVESKGVNEEAQKNKRTGKPSFGIHPNMVKDKIETFNLIHTLGFANQEEFFGAIAASRDSKFDNTPTALLRQFLMDSQDLPRYACLQPFAPAAIIKNKSGEYLLFEQPAHKPFAGHLTPATGKRKEVNGRLESTAETLGRETCAEVGLDVTGVSPEYHLERADYGRPTDVKYVRFVEVEYKGRVRPSDEAVKPRWMPLSQILSGQHKIMPATLRYFQNLAKQKSR